MDLDLTSVDCIKDLTNEEIASISMLMSDDQKILLLKYIEELNKMKIATISEYNNKITNETEINNIFLNRVWRNLQKDSKKDCAIFFKDIYDDINSEY